MPTATGVVATPTTAATPGPVTTASVAFAVSATNGVNPISASFSVTYDSAKGSFTGAAATTACTLSGSTDSFVSNDNDTGTLQLALNSQAGLTLPATITCTFDQAAGAITPADLTIANKVIAVLDQNQIPVAGNPDDLIIGTTVTQQ